MDKVIYKILDEIEKNGYEAYIVGGFVRDKILGINSKDIDICTNATPQELHNIFKYNITLVEEYGAVKLKLDNYNIDITTYRKEKQYKKNKPTKIEYINSLEEDIKRRDFTINTICMDKNGKIIDLLNGKRDIKNKTIKMVGDINKKMKEDSTRILRALRFMTILDFALDKSLKLFIINNPKSIIKISYEKRKEELEKIFKSQNLNAFFSFIKQNNLEKYIGIESNNFVKTNTIIGVWSQLKINKNYKFSKLEQTQIKNIKELINKSDIDRYDVYKYGTYVSSVASEILGLDKKNIDIINNNLQIHNKSEIDITSEEICNILNIKPSKKLGKIIKNIEKEIVYDKIVNNKERIIEYLNNYKA